MFRFFNNDNMCKIYFLNILINLILNKFVIIQDMHDDEHIKFLSNMNIKPLNDILQNVYSNVVKKNKSKVLR